MCESGVGGLVMCESGVGGLVMCESGVGGKCSASTLLNERELRWCIQVSLTRCQSCRVLGCMSYLPARMLYVVFPRTYLSFLLQSLHLYSLPAALAGLGVKDFAFKTCSRTRLHASVTV